MFYLHNKRDRHRNSKFASVRLFYLHSSRGLLLELDCSICNIMEIEQSVTESMHSAVSNRLFYLHVS